MEVIVLILFILGGIFLLIGVNLLYDIAAAIIPVVAVLLITIGILVGLVVAVKNTCRVYRRVYGKKGK